MPRKPSYEIVEENVKEVVSYDKTPKVIKATLKKYPKGAYLWCPKIWAGKDVYIMEPEFYESLMACKKRKDKKTKNAVAVDDKAKESVAKRKRGRPRKVLVEVPVTKDGNTPSKAEPAAEAAKPATAEKPVAAGGQSDVG